jgi:repressor LexA
MTRQGQILQVIERYIAVHGCSPSNREIAEAAGLKSPSTVLRYLRQLKADGYLTYQPGVPRTVRILPSPRRPADDEQALDTSDPDQVVWVPFLGPMPRDMAVARGEARLLHVSPGSVTAPGVQPGDWVVVRRPPGGPPHGTVIAVLRQVEPVTAP